MKYRFRDLVCGVILLSSAGALAENCNSTTLPSDIRCARRSVVNTASPVALGVGPNSPGQQSIIFGQVQGKPSRVVIDVLPGGLPERIEFSPYGEFSGGVYVAAAAVIGVKSVVVTGPGPGGGPNVKAFQIQNGSAQVIANFNAYDPTFTGGVRVGAAPNSPFVVTGPGPGGGPHVKVWDLLDLRSPIAEYFPFPQSFTGGVYVALGDVDGDGTFDIVVGAGPGREPEVVVISGSDGRELHRFLAYDRDFSGGVRVACADLNYSQTAEIIVGPGPSGGPHTKIFSGSGVLLEDFLTFHTNTAGIYPAAIGAPFGPQTVFGIPSFPL